MQPNKYENAAIKKRMKKENKYQATFDSATISPPSIWIQIHVQHSGGAIVFIGFFYTTTEM